MVAGAPPPGDGALAVGRPDALILPNDTFP
jgi:hypothetical protein